MRVVFLTTDLTSPAVRFRVTIYEQALRDAGISLLVLPCEPNFYEEPKKYRNRIGYHSLNLAKMWSRWNAINQVRRDDIAIIQRELIPYNSAWFEARLARRARAILLDWDDAVYLNYPNPDSEANKMAKICHLATRVLCGNATLKEYAERWGAATDTLPTPVAEDPDFSPALREAVYDGSKPFVIGWTGSTGTLDCIREMAEPLNAILRAHPNVIVRIMSNWHEDTSKPELGFPYEFVRWNPTIERPTVRTFSVGLMPLADTPFNRGKCSLKILQYMAAGVPAIASPVGNNTEVIQDGVNGRLASTAGEWQAAIESLITSPQDCLRLGLAGRETLEHKYSLSVCATRLIEILKAL